MILRIKYLQNYDRKWGDLEFKKGNSAIDLRAAIDKQITLHPGERTVIPTGISIQLVSENPFYQGEIEEDTVELQVRPRSGLSARQGLVNIIGTIDSSYRGEIGAIVYNMNQAIIPDFFTINSLGRDIESYERSGEQVPTIYNKNAEVVINPGDRIAQLIVSKILKPTIAETTSLGTTDRGDKGFGSSGVK